MQLNKVNKEYVINNQYIVHALSDITLSLPDKGLIFIVGKSGSGKSTLLNIIGGMDRVSSGEINLGQIDITHLSDHELNAYRNEIVGFIFQDFNLIESLTVYQNLSLSIPLKSQETHQMISQVLSQVGLDGYESRMPNTLSGGQKQRIAIARSILKKSHILLADEPTGSLDTETSKQIFELLKSLSHEFLVIVVSHDRESAKDFGDRVIEISDGRIINDTYPVIYNEEMLDKPKQSRFHLGYSFLLGLQNAKHFSLRLVMTMILASLFFLFMSLSDAIGQYDATKQIAASFSNTSLPYIHVLKRDKTEDVEGRVVLLDDKDINDYKTIYEHDSIYPIFTGFGYTLKYDLFDSIPSYDVYPASYSGAMVIDPGTYSDLGLSLVTGILPVEINQIAITKRMADHYMTFGLIEGDQRIDFESYEDIIGMVLSYGEYGDLEIVGILDTYFDQEKYDVLLNVDSVNPFKYDLLYRELNVINGSIHELVFISQALGDFITDKIDNHFVLPTTYQVDIKIDTGFSVTPLDVYNVQSHSYDNLDILWLNQNDELNKDGILLSYSYVYNQLDIVHILLLVDQLLDEFVDLHYDEIKDQFEAEQTVSYKDYIKSNQNNTYHPGFTGSYFFQQATLIEINNLLDDTSHDVTLSMDGISFKDYEIVGLIKENSSPTLNTIVLNDQEYRELIQSSGIRPYNGMIYNTRDGENLSSSLIDDFHLKDNEIYLQGRHPILEHIRYLDSVFTEISTILGYISVGIFILTVLVLFTLIYSSIQARKKDIGILRSMGSNFLHIYTWFTAESFIVLMMSSIIALSLLG
ncbi:MAG: ABC transporter ATP-binding protein, partial [Acholeplasmataceae bacterium]|nr:ABC transporter ATP-binding protein [Acholeplasmataceae bacterium]